MVGVVLLKPTLHEGAALWLGSNVLRANAPLVLGRLQVVAVEAREI